MQTKEYLLQLQVRQGTHGAAAPTSALPSHRASPHPTCAPLPTAQGLLSPEGAGRLLVSLLTAARG